MQEGKAKTTGNSNWLMQKIFQSNNENGIYVDAQLDELQKHWYVLLTGAFLLSKHNIQAGRVLRYGIARFGLCISAVLNCLALFFNWAAAPEILST